MIYIDVLYDLKISRAWIVFLRLAHLPMRASRFLPELQQVLAAFGERAARGRHHLDLKGAWCLDKKRVHLNTHTRVVGCGLQHLGLQTPPGL